MYLTGRGVYVHIAAPLPSRYAIDVCTAAILLLSVRYFEARSRGVGAAEAEAAFLSCYPVAGVSGESVFSTMWTHRWKASVQHG
jgi:hypothetical protein